MLYFSEKHVLLHQLFYHRRRHVSDVIGEMITALFQTRPRRQKDRPGWEHKSWDPLVVLGGLAWGPLWGFLLNEGGLVRGMTLTRGPERSGTGHHNEPLLFLRADLFLTLWHHVSDSGQSANGSESQVKLRNVWGVFLVPFSVLTCSMLLIYK